MNKKLTLLLTVILLCVVCTVNAFAASASLTDNANLLTEEEEAALLTKLNTASEKHKVDMVVVTLESFEGDDAKEYADTYYDNNGYGDDGILLLISMENRDIAISAAGVCKDAFSQDDVDELIDEIGGYLSTQYYAKGIEVFINESDSLVEDELSFNLGGSLITSLIIGLIIAFIATSVMKGKLKSVHYQSGAAGYIKNGSLNITDSRDIFLYTQVTRRARPKSTSGGGSSSSGRSHGGGSGKF